jgi:uncharacterized coiled-coil protein SlyX
MSGAPKRRRRTAGGPVPRRLTALELGEVSLVDLPANAGSRHILAKIAEGQPAEDAGADPDAEQAATIEDLRRQIAESQAAHAENQAALAVVTERLIAATSAAAAPAAPEPAPAEPAAPEPPARTPWQREDAELAGLAIIAQETPEKAGREFWRGQIDALGRHLAPNEPPTRQVAAALDDPRGRAFVEALQSRPA